MIFYYFLLQRIIILLNKKCIPVNKNIRYNLIYNVISNILILVIYLSNTNLFNYTYINILFYN